MINRSVRFAEFIGFNEAAYRGNIGFMETAKFYQTAKPNEIKELKELIKDKKFKEAWTLIQRKTNSMLMGAEFNIE